MITWIVLILGGLVAYRALSAGIYAVLSRTLMGVLAVAASIGFAGPLHEQLPFDHEYAYSGCLLAITLLVYAFQRTLSSYFLSDRLVTLPEYIDRIGSVVVGFAGGVMAFSFLALVVAAAPWPESLNRLAIDFRNASRMAVDTARIVSIAAGTGQPITTRTVMPRPAPPPVKDRDNKEVEPEDEYRETDQPVTSRPYRETR